jgi:hypothetical protein
MWSIKCFIGDACFVAEEPEHYLLWCKQRLRPPKHQSTKQQGSLTNNKSCEITITVKCL